MGKNSPTGTGTERQLAFKPKLSPSGPNHTKSEASERVHAGGDRDRVPAGAAHRVWGVWNLLKMSRKKSSENQSDSESETDSMDLDLQNTDLESRIGSRPPSRSASRASRARSSRSRRRSPLSSRTGRTLSPQSSIQCSSIQEIDQA